MKRLIRSLKTFMADYKESANRYGDARLTVYEGLLAENKDIDFEYQHGSSANSPR